MIQGFLGVELVNLACLEDHRFSLAAPALIHMDLLVCQVLSRGDLAGILGHLGGKNRRCLKDQVLKCCADVLEGLEEEHIQTCSTFTMARILYRESDFYTIIIISAIAFYVQDYGCFPLFLFFKFFLLFSPALTPLPLLG
ncbi:hypothetical protein CDL12_25228 [Handroanthus impetiginosus]|uniref:Uncharacterized protein n=1 Tax=Handroanthus impetiginosus TaxID=429701 RepID=A0A2G9GAD8_9LAMI|nr:hypothetical protein CDL12_25228 [Handroanthus impetiginosus]